jgi:hypothetical protein
MKTALVLAALFALLGITVAWAIYAWNAVDVEMSVHGYVAMTLGIVFSLQTRLRRTPKRRPLSPTASRRAEMHVRTI